MASDLTEDALVNNVIEKMRTRSAAGMQKYGVAIGDNPGDVKHWLEQCQEELTDAAIYLERAMAELKKA